MIDGMRTLRGFTLIELLVAVTIISILMSFILVLVAQTRERGRRVLCASNQRQWAAGIMAFALSDWDPCPNVIFSKVQGNGRENSLNAEEMIQYLDGGEGIAGVNKFSATSLAGIWNCPSATWTKYGGWGDGGGTDALHWGYSYFGRVSEWKNHRGTNYGSNRPEDLTDRRLEANRLLFSDALYIWEGNFAEGNWMYNHTKSVTRNWDGTLAQMAGMNQAFGDGSVRWKDSAQFDYEGMRNRDGNVPRVKSDDLLTYY
jgi:prepilin-type N-terminal cleavage/methylation domain-containing protein